MATPPTTSLHEAVLQLARLQRARLADVLAPHGLHPGQDALLMLLWAQPGLRQAELARRLAVEPPTVTRMVQRLERSGLVERRKDPHDGRLARVFATPRAKLLEGVVRRAWADQEAALTAALGPARSAELVRLLREAATAIRPAERPSG